MERTSPREREASAADRSAWRSLTSRPAAAFEEDRRQRLAAARDRRHRAASAATRTPDHRCDTCGPVCFQLWTVKSRALSSPRAQTVSSSYTEGLPLDDGRAPYDHPREFPSPLSPAAQGGQGSGSKGATSLFPIAASLSITRHSSCKPPPPPTSYPPLPPPPSLPRPGNLPAQPPEQTKGGLCMKRDPGIQRISLGGVIDSIQWVDSLILRV